MAAKEKPASAPEKKGAIIANVKEETAVETYWHAAGRSKMRRPPKNHKEN